MGRFFVNKMRRSLRFENKFFKNTKQNEDDSDIEYGNAKTFQLIQGEGPA